MTTSVVSLPYYHAFKSIGAERKNSIFALIQFLLTGIVVLYNRDLFNLYVCFEVMLLASYVLLSLGGRAQLGRD